MKSPTGIPGCIVLATSGLPFSSSALSVMFAFSFSFLSVMCFFIEINKFFNVGSSSFTPCPNVTLWSPKHSSRSSHYCGSMPFSTTKRFLARCRSACARIRRPKSFLCRHGKQSNFIDAFIVSFLQKSWKEKELMEILSQTIIMQYLHLSKS